MKQFLLFLFVLIFPILFALWWFCAVTWQLIKHSFLIVRKEYHSAKKEFERSNGTNIS